MQDFKKLSVWKRAHEFTLRIYAVTGSFPREEIYGLTSQLRRATSSIPANIAEGSGRDGGSDFARFLQIAIGSASEVEYHLLLAFDLGFLRQDDYEDCNREVNEIRRMLSHLTRRVRQPPSLDPNNN